MNKVALRDGVGFTPSTFSKLNDNKLVSLTTLGEICESLGCNLGDIVDYIPENRKNHVEGKVDNQCKCKT